MQAMRDAARGEEDMSASLSTDEDSLSVSGVPDSELSEIPLKVVEEKGEEEGAGEEKKGEDDGAGGEKNGEEEGAGGEKKGEREKKEEKGEEEGGERVVKVESGEHDEEENEGTHPMADGEFY